MALSLPVRQALQALQDQTVLQNEIHLTVIRNSTKTGLGDLCVQSGFSYTYYNVESCRIAYHGEIHCFRMIRSGKTEASIKSAGSMSSASARLKNTSSEKLFATPGASMALIRERLISAFSASCSCDIPRILRSAAIAMPR